MLICTVFMWMTILSAQAQAEPEQLLKPVQVFDVAVGKVAKTVANDQEYQTYAKQWLNSVTGLSPKVKPDDKCGYVFRVPLEKPVVVRTKDLLLTAEEVFLFHCPGKLDQLLVFDQQRKAYLLLFQSDLKPFFAKIGIPPAANRP
jgi:hypothetical protein